jgi:hypothetical protein
MPVVLVKKPLDPNIRTRQVANEVQKTLRFYGDVSAKRRQSVVSGWENEKPGFFEITKNVRNKITLEVRMGGPEFGKKKWIWLSFGTKVRYAQMTDDFQAKTKVGSFFSGAGRGGVDFIGRTPLPGIKARNWDKISRARDKKIFDNEIIASVDKVLGTRRFFKLSRQGEKLANIISRIS